MGGGSNELDILILGAGWTATFLIPLLRAKKLTFAATTRDGRKVANESTIKWSFNPDEPPSYGSQNQFSVLPSAKSVVIVFPLVGHGQSSTLFRGYTKAQRNNDVQFIQLGSTGIWQIPQSSCWVNRKSPYDTSNSRAIAEDELKLQGGCILNLGGLWGHERDAIHWVDRIAKTKEDVKSKKSLHMIHGLDVARAIVAVTEDWEAAKGQRFMLTDGFVYDWWSLFAGWGDNGKNEDDDIARQPLRQAQWVYELMQEEGVRGLPRDNDVLGRCYDSRDFWSTFSLAPLKAGLSR